MNIKTMFKFGQTVYGIRENNNHEWEVKGKSTIDECNIIVYGNYNRPQKSISYKMLCVKYKG